jgi:hypothetical protein
MSAITAVLCVGINAVVWFGAMKGLKVLYPQSGVKREERLRG